MIEFTAEQSSAMCNAYLAEERAKRSRGPGSEGLVIPSTKRYLEPLSDPALFDMRILSKVGLKVVAPRAPWDTLSSILTKCFTDQILSSHEVGTLIYMLGLCTIGRPNTVEIASSLGVVVTDEPGTVPFDTILDLDELTLAQKTVFLSSFLLLDNERLGAITFDDLPGTNSVKDEFFHSSHEMVVTYLMSLCIFISKKLDDKSDDYLKNRRTPLVSITSSSFISEYIMNLNTAISISKAFQEASALRSFGFRVLMELAIQSFWRYHQTLDYVSEMLEWCSMTHLSSIVMLASSHFNVLLQEDMFYRDVEIYKAWYSGIPTKKTEMFQYLRLLERPGFFSAVSAKKISYLTFLATNARKATEFSMTGYKGVKLADEQDKRQILRWILQVHLHRLYLKALKAHRVVHDGRYMDYPTVPITEDQVELFDQVGTVPSLPQSLFLGRVPGQRPVQPQPSAVPDVIDDPMTGEGVPLDAVVLDPALLSIREMINSLPA